jgi:pimeloyl-ACP methyl ester carboxylesterase
MKLALPSGITLHCVDEGEGEALVLLHGGMGDCDSWSPQLPSLARYFRTVAYSRRFSGSNRNGEPPPGYGLSDDVQDLAAFASGLGLHPFHLAGTSYGALLALAFALEHPGAVRSLVLCEPPLHRWAARTAAGGRFYGRFLADAWQPAADAFLRGHDQHALQLLTDGMWGRPVFDRLPAQRVTAALRNAAAMRAIVQSADPFPDLPRPAVARLSMPTLLVQGEHASALHRMVMDELAGTMAGAVRAVIPAAGHGAAWENPETFNAVLLEFLQHGKH